MKALKIAAVALTSLALGTGALMASSHGNDLVHARKYKGIVYTMNAVHMSLYTYDNDAPGVSNCYDDCAVNWPPALLDAGAKLGKNYTLIKRNDGTWQIAYKNKPLYLFKGDKRIGDINGDGLGGVWRLSKP
jgi:predicted lipoprotein with Yx(FWY)xxD motif